jgi:hypothetical protein
VEKLISKKNDAGMGGTNERKKAHISTNGKDSYELLYNACITRGLGSY